MLLVVLLLFELWINVSKESFVKWQEVFFEQSDPSIHYYLSFEQLNCTSLTIDEFFAGYDVKLETIYPKNVLVISDEKINAQLEALAYDSEKSLNQRYLSILEKYGLKEDVERVIQQGFLISKVEVIMSEGTLQKLLEQNRGLQYSTYRNGNYQ